jgi:ABC-type sugar transport system ATPase subunit|uniref:sugar ABC transporter ATP-binding protein n=1 Tax=Candidatus Planktophila sp. TaxID=2175601 RepID=UPI00404A2708
MNSQTAHKVISVRGLAKRYGGVKALNGLDLDLEAKKVHAIVGENGAGKSTFMKILSGGVTPDEGTIEVLGEKFSSFSVQSASKLGIGIMYQELRLFQHRDVLTNLFPDREMRIGPFIDRKKMAEIAIPVLKSIGLDVDLKQIVGELALSDQQLIELARVLIEKPKLLILDEPTSALNARESERLLDLVRLLPEQGTTVLYVSHRLDEVFSVSQHITVLRNGSLVFSKPTSELDIPTVIGGIVGEKSVQAIVRKNSGEDSKIKKEKVLEVANLSNGRQVVDISLDVAPGEIVGVAGLIGSGADELLETLFGARQKISGSVKFQGAEKQNLSPQNSVRDGIALIPADRKRVGLMIDRTVSDNLSQVSAGGFKRGTLFVSKSGLAATAVRLVEKFVIKTENVQVRVGNLSGGNQQKVVIGKWLEISPGLVLLDDPTRGVDIGAKVELFRLIREIADEGKGVLFRSTEISELTALCDRIVVVKDGVSTREVSGVDDAELIKLINE